MNILTKVAIQRGILKLIMLNIQTDSLFNIIDAVQSLQSLTVKNYYLTICRICLVIKHQETFSFIRT